MATMYVYLFFSTGKKSPFRYPRLDYVEFFDSKTPSVDNLRTCFKLSGFHKNSPDLRGSLAQHPLDSSLNLPIPATSCMPIYWYLPVPYPKWFNKNKKISYIFYPSLVQLAFNPNFSECYLVVPWKNNEHLQHQKYCKGRNF